MFLTQNYICTVILVCPGQEKALLYLSAQFIRALVQPETNILLPFMQYESSAPLITLQPKNVQYGKKIDHEHSCTSPPTVSSDNAKDTDHQLPAATTPQQQIKSKKHINRVTL